MHVSMTDLLTCPRCGPDHGLVLVPGEVRERRVVEGVLGCPNCRERYAVRGGVADFTGGEAGAAGGADPPSRAAGEAGGGEGAVRLAGLLGLAEASGVVVLAGDAGREAEAVADLVPDVEVVRVVGAGAESASMGAVTRVRVAGRLPFRTGSVRGVALEGSGVALLEESARVLASGGRLVAAGVGEAERGRVASAGLRELASEGGTVVWERVS